MEVIDNKEAGTVVLGTPFSHMPEAFIVECAELKYMKGVLLTKYKSYADAHLFIT